MKKQSKIFVIFYILICIAYLFPLSVLQADEDSVCAQVKIEIQQELTLERQAFDAHMKINNGLIHAALQNINVEVWATDKNGNPVEISSDSNDADALFFIRLDEMTNIDNVSGSGQVPPDDFSDIHWLIIPAPGASNGMTSGTRYNVGATLTYTLGGEENTIEVSPDYIFVKPMPEITLDYFLPSQVYGDDPFTGEIEASTPFSLGVRVQNSGAGAVQNLKIDSAQPRIIDNEQGLLINFTIQGSEIDGKEMSESLLIDFGTIESNTASTARWVMTCSLSGKFVSFDASFTHADELGGELTSLIAAVNTHTLVRDVLVDVPGRDGIRDFLSQAGSQFTVYESDNTTSDVTNVSSGASLTLSENTGEKRHYTLTTDPAAGFVYVSLPDPQAGTKYLERVIRSDGKQISTENAWLSKVQDADTHEWSYLVNLFDANTTASYTLVFTSLSASPQAPVLQFISDKNTLENRQVSFITQASDPNGTIPALTASPLPAGAVFTDNGDGTAVFDWTPVAGQKGVYDITFTASDGALSSGQQVCLIVFDANDLDMDGMTDDWETTYFGDLSRDGTGDFDLDGVTDLQEFTDQTNPALDDSAPTTPDPLYPHPNVDVEESSPELVIEDSTDTQDDEIDYAFEIYEDEEMTQLVADDARVSRIGPPNEIMLYSLVADNGTTGVPVIGSTTTWQVPVTLKDNTRYYWRVRSADQDGSSLWAYNNFFINTVDDPPSDFGAASPENNTGVDSLTPALSVMNSQDIDNDVITYSFAVYSDDTLQTRVAASGTVAQGTGTTTAWTVPSGLEDQTYYYWQATADDGNGGTTLTAVYTIYTDTENHAPGTPSGLLPDGTQELETTSTVLTVTNAEDLDQDSISYIFELDTSDLFNSPGKQTSGLIPEGNGTTSWHISGLKENTRYYWRVKATDGDAHSPWVTGQFFVNQMNDAPGTPTVKNPGAGAWTETLTPVLSLQRTIDPDKDTLEYQFEMYANQALTRFVYQVTSDTPDWTLSFDLENNAWYYWRARAVDEHGVAGPWTAISSFFVKTDCENQPPVIELTEPFESVITNAQILNIGWTDEDPDSNAVIDLYYDIDDQGEDGVLIATDLSEDDEGDKDIYAWDMSSLPDGTYYIYAQIRDETSAFTHYAPITITIDRTPPVLSITPPAAEYEETIYVEMSASEPSVIYYTLDGSTPVQGGLEYAGPIELTASATLKCMAVDGPGNMTEVQTHEYILIPGMVTVEVLTDKEEPVIGAKVKLFETPEADIQNKTGIHATTNELGIVELDPESIETGLYQFKINYLGAIIWSDIISLPDTRYTKVTVPVETVELTLTSSNGALEGYNVYLFSKSGSYLDQTQITDENGQVRFVLPVGKKYDFMADVMGKEYWIDNYKVESGGTNQIDFNAGGGLLTVTFQKDSLEPITNARLYLYNSDGTYLDQYRKTDQNGQAKFELAEGNYIVRAEHLGYWFWTETTTVSENTAIELTLPHTQIIVGVSGKFNDDIMPMPDIETRLFTADGTAVDLSAVTDSDGNAVYSVPDRAYKIQAHVFGAQFWSNTFSNQDTCITIPMARAKVFVNNNGTPANDIPVHLFSGADIDLEKVNATNSQGKALFTIPAGSYIFKADYNDDLFQSRLSPLPADLVTPVYVSVGQGRFEFTATTESGSPIQGAQIHVFTQKKSHTGLTSATDNAGHAFFDLNKGTYLFQIEYMGEKYWSDPVKTHKCTSTSLVVPHQDVQVSLSNRNAPMAGAAIYVFSKPDLYLGHGSVADDSGSAVFSLPVGLKVQFRADTMGCSVYSNQVKVHNRDSNSVTINMGGGAFALNLLNRNLNPIPGLRVRLLTRDDADTGYSAITDALGQVIFEVPKGKFKAETLYLDHLFRTKKIRIHSNKQRDFIIPDIQDPFIPPFIGAN